MGSSQLETISKFIVSDERHWGVGLKVHEVLPEIMKKVSLDFLEQIWKTYRQTSGYTYPKDGQRDYYSPTRKHSRKSHLAVYRTSWQHTQIRLEAVWENDHWGIGVVSQHPQFAKDQAGYTELKAALTKEFGNRDEDWWLWWQYIDEEYKNWRSIIPTLHRECEEGGGEATMYFVEKMASIAEVAVPIIDRYEGT